jgi:tetratricopeptide (TPR) repeat protein
MAVRGSGGLLLCIGLLPAVPALAATPTDRGECAASADKPDIGFAACSRIIDDEKVSAAERV